VPETREPRPDLARSEGGSDDRVVETIEETIVDDGPTQAERTQMGRTFGRYVVSGKLGSGAMGVVFAAFDPDLDRQVAIKLLHPRPGSDEESEAAQLLEEARAMARHSHPNVVTIHDVGTMDGRVFIAMEHVEGETMADWLRTPRTAAKVLPTLIAAGEGLAAAHDQGLVHRDFKPENVMLGADGRVLVMDFGLAREHIDPDPAPASLNDERPGAGDKTSTGFLVGTPAYMAPELFASKPADALSDQFAFCVSAYEALYGERPFKGNTPGALFIAMAEDGISEPPADRHVPVWIRRTLLRGLERDPALRYADMRALLSALGRRPTRARTWLLGLGGLATTAAVVVGATGRPTPCQGAQQHLDGVWDAQRSEAMRRAMEATGSAIGPDTVVRVTERLDRYTAEWVAMRRESCLATRVHGTQSESLGDLRLACLDQRLRGVEQVVSVLEHADQTVIRNAVSTVAGLEPLSSCADAASLETDLPIPDDPQAVAELRARLDQVNALMMAGRFTDGIALADTLQETVADIDYIPVMAEVQLRRGNILAEAGQLGPAEDALSAAYFSALQVNHDFVAAEAASLLAYVVGYRNARHQEGREWGEHALASALRAKDPGLAEASARHNIGVVANAMGDDETATQNYTRAYELRVALLDPEHPDIARSLNALGNGHFRRAEYAEALDDYQTSLDIRERVFGPNHPEVAGALNNVALVLRLTGELPAARDALRRSVEIYTAALGESHPDVAQARNNLGRVLRGSGDPVAAAAEHRRALKIREVTQGADHPDVGDALVGLGRALSDSGEHAEAEAMHERALGLYERGFGPTHTAVGDALLGLAVARLGLGRTLDAKAALVRARTIYAPMPQAPQHTEILKLLQQID